MDIDLYKSVVAFVRKTNKASVSHIQRNFYLCYARASEIMDKLESEYVVSLMSASGRRDVYPEIVAELTSQINDLKAKLEAAQVKDGFVLVPKEPTLKMLVTYEVNSIAPISSLSVRGYKAMIEAAQGEGHE